MMLNDLIPSPIDCAREAVNDPCLHFNNRADGVKDKVGYVVTEETSHLVGSDASLVFYQVNSSFELYGIKGFSFCSSFSPFIHYTTP